MKENTLVKPGMLLVANWDSNVGYAWWLIESYWTVIHELYSGTHQVYLCYPSISTIPSAIEDSGIKIQKLNFSPQSGSLLEQCQFIHQNNIKCIYFSDQPAISLTYALYRAIGVRKIIVHDHTPGLRTIPHTTKKLLKSIISLAPVITVDGYIGATPFVQKRAIDVTCIPKRKTYVARNGIPINNQEKHENISQRFGIPSDRKIMISTGRAHHYKGIAFAIRCVSELVHKHQRTDLHFLFCGDGPHLNEFRQLAIELSIEDYVSLPGRLSGIENIINACDFAMQPSSGEVGYSLSILEYMLSGLPVIVPDNPSVSGATDNGETGLIYTHDNISSACQSITELLNDPKKRRSMGEAARKTIISKYSLDNTHRELETILKKVYPIES